MSRKKIIKSSGIIMNEDQAAAEVHVFVMNLDTNSDRHVKVEVFDWETLAPISVTVNSESGPQEIPGGGGPIEIEENTAAEFEALLQGVLEYEVRVTIFDKDEDVVVTSQGVTASNNNVVGQTILNRNFTRVDLD